MEETIYVYSIKIICFIIVLDAIFFRDLLTFSFLCFIFTISMCCLISSQIKQLFLLLCIVPAPFHNTLFLRLYKKSTRLKSLSTWFYF